MVFKGIIGTFSWVLGRESVNIWNYLLSQRTISFPKELFPFSKVQNLQQLRLWHDLGIPEMQTTALVR